MDSENEDVEEPRPSTSRARLLNRSSKKTSAKVVEDSSDKEATPKRRKITQDTSGKNAKRRLDGGDENENSQSRRKRNKRYDEEINSSDDEYQPKSKKMPAKSKSKAQNSSSQSQSGENYADGFASSQAEGFTCSQSEHRSNPGIIKTLHLKNFMCHTDFSHNFHPNLNFITGQNGSGKSALLSGLLIALGGKALSTSRTTSVKQLVQKGKSVARVAVTLNNMNGVCRYGDEITIEKYINVSGSSGYRLKSTVGNGVPGFGWRAMKKTELDYITMGLNIQVDNPVAILNQEIARSFLRSKDPKTKYKLFYDGAILSKIEEALDETEENLKKTYRVLSVHKVTIDGITEEVAQLTAKYNQIAKLDSIRIKLDKVHGEWLWSIVIEKERVVHELTKEVQMLEADISALQKRLVSLQAEYDGTNEDSIVRQEEELRRSINSKRRSLEGCKAELGEIRRKQMAFKNQLKLLVMSIQGKESRLQKLIASLEKVKAEQEARAQDESNAESNALDELKSKKNNLESILAGLKLDADNFHNAFEEERARVAQLESQARKISADIDGKKRMIHQLNSKTINKYEQFGSQMGNLMNRIKASAHKFKYPPRGPLGACIRVKDQKYAAMIESILGNNLHSFVVGDSRDLTLLKGLIDTAFDGGRGNQRSSQFGGRPSRVPSIHCMRFADQMYDISRAHASLRNAPSIFELIEVDNDDHILWNALIDVAEIERQIIFINNIAAAQVLKHEKNVPKTLKGAYTLQWYKFTPAPHYAARVMHMKKRVDILVGGNQDREGQKRAIEQEIVELQETIRNVQKEKAGYKKKEEEVHARAQAKTNEVADMRRKLGEVENELRRHLQLMKDKQKRGDFTSFYEEIEDLKEEVEKGTKERDVVTKNLEPLEPKIADLESTKQEMENVLSSLNEKLQEFDDVRDKYARQRSKLENGVRKAKDMVAAKEVAIKQRKKDLEAQEAELKEKIAKAERSCPERVDTRRTPISVRNEFDRLKMEIDEGERRLGSKENVETELKAKRKKLNELKAEFNPYWRMYKTVKSTWVEQATSFTEVKSCMGSNLGFFFRALAKQRGYEGRMYVDHVTRELYYFVCPDGDSSTKMIKALDDHEKYSGPKDEEHTKQDKVLKKALIEYSLGLSGGERSFATICFILSLWQVMECPFYMLDEFDVFMDAFNRKTSQMALMAHAKAHIRNQFVLFTPLDLVEVPTEKEACILRLFPPKRSAEGNSGGGPSSQMSPPGENSTQQGTSPGSPNNSTENIDPNGSVAAKKGTSKKARQRRPQAANVMGLMNEN